MDATLHPRLGIGLGRDCLAVVAIPIDSEFPRIRAAIAIEEVPLALPQHLLVTRKNLAEVKPVYREGNCQR